VPAFTPSELHQILTDFRRRLEAIGAYCEQIGAVPILVIPASNESGFEPNRTVLSARVSQAQRAELTEQFQQTRALETDDPAQSETRYRSLLDRQPDLAEAHFRLGRLLERAGAFDEACEHYIRARDLDGFPVRCRSDLAQIYRDVAAHNNSILVDGSEVLRATSRHGILDDALFHDARHPTLASHLNLAQAVLDQLHQRRLLRLGGEGAPAPIIDPAACASRFQIDFQVWAAACVKAGLYFKHLSAARYDSEERVAKQLRFEQAALQIREGLRLPEQVEIPGVGLPPPVSYRWDWWAERLPAGPDKTRLEKGHLEEDAP
jgi:tetratricopeptide (TPR) repeat protein